MRNRKDLKRTMLKRMKLPQKRKKKKTQTSLQKEGLGKRRTDSVKDDYDVVKHKHLLLLVHAPTNYEVGSDIINGTGL